MKSKFVFSNPNINRLVLNGYHYTEEDTLDALNDIYLSSTETLCRRNNLTIDGIYVINLEKHECGDSSKIIDLLNDFVMERIMLEKYGYNSIMIFLVCDYTCPIYKYIHKAGFVKMADCDNDNIAVYIGSTPFTNFIYDITRTEKDLGRTNRSDKPLFS